MKLSTRALALAAARRPWRTVAAWALSAVLAVAAVTAFLGDLSPEGKPTNNPESQRALALEARAFPPDPRSDATELVVVRSDRYEVVSPQFRSFVERLVAETRATDAGTSARSYLDGSPGNGRSTTTSTSSRRRT